MAMRPLFVVMSYIKMTAPQVLATSRGRHFRDQQFSLNQGTSSVARLSQPKTVCKSAHVLMVVALFPIRFGLP